MTTAQWERTDGLIHMKLSPWKIFHISAGNHMNLCNCGYFIGLANIGVLRTKLDNTEKQWSFMKCMKMKLKWCCIKPKHRETTWLHPEEGINMAVTALNLFFLITLCSSSWHMKWMFDKNRSQNLLLEPVRFANRENEKWKHLKKWNRREQNDRLWHTCDGCLRFCSRLQSVISINNKWWQTTGWQH